MRRLKIDVCFWGEPHYCLYRSEFQKRWFGLAKPHEVWSSIGAFKSIEEARAFALTIKDLPEYV